ncbi:MAG: hypothetical protein JWN78_2845 [Bacteroidota bacterium]|nr:hypothetical protein [Bacteroidota bacterium]
MESSSSPSLEQSCNIIKKKFYGGKFDDQDPDAGYTEAVFADNILYLSGAIGGGTISEQLHKIYTDLGNILNAYGATYQNVVKETLYTTDIEAVKENNSVRKAFYHNDFPAATWLQVTRLFSARADAQVEVELIAHLQRDKN